MNSLFAKLSFVLLFAFPYLWLWLKLIKTWNVTSLPAQTVVGVVAALGLVIAGAVIILIFVVLTAAIRILVKKVFRQSQR